jgi:prepilin-type N-terminal cleavage/methylation domain-containing protein
MDHRRRSAFTLVELLTVMGILGILVALVVGAAHSISQSAARTETEQTLAAIQAGLARYYEDWHKFPWYEDRNQWGGSEHPLTGEVRGGTRNTPGYRPLNPRETRGDPAAACLYASLNMDERNGPYYAGAAGNIDTVAIQDAERYMVFVDGWERPIRYFQPPPKAVVGETPPSGAGRSDPEFYTSAPLLMSEGPEKDMPAVEETKEDNIYNYPVETPPDDNMYFQ